MIRFKKLLLVLLSFNGYLEYRASYISIVFSDFTTPKDSISRARSMHESNLALS